MFRPQHCICGELNLDNQQFQQDKRFKHCRNGLFLAQIWHRQIRETRRTVLSH